MISSMPMRRLAHFRRPPWSGRLSLAAGFVILVVWVATSGEGRLERPGNRARRARPPSWRAPVEAVASLSADDLSATTEERGRPLPLRASSWSDVGAACDALPQARDLGAVFELPLPSWTRLRIAAAAAAAGCNSASSFPVRETRRMFRASALASRDAQARGGYLVHAAPLDLSQAMLARVDAPTACTYADWLSSGPDDAGAASAAPGSDGVGVVVEDLSAMGLSAVLCRRGAMGHSAALNGRVRLDGALVHDDLLVGVVRPCHDGHAAAVPHSAVASLLFDGAVGDPSADGLLETLSNAHPLPCGRELALAEAYDALRDNYVALHSAEEHAVLQEPAAVAASLTRPAIDPAFPFVWAQHQHGLELARSLRAGDLRETRRLLLPGGMHTELPSFLSAFNVLVHPQSGEIVSLASVLGTSAPSVGATQPPSSSGPAQGASAFAALLAATYEVEPDALRQLRGASKVAFAAAFMGGADASSFFAARAPEAIMNARWPVYASPELREWPSGDVAAAAPDTLSGSSSSAPFVSRVLNLDGNSSTWALNVSAWQSLRVYDEMLVLYPPTAKYYFLALDVVALLELAQPLLVANPRLALHLPDSFELKAGAVRAVLDVLGLGHHPLVFGWAVARIAHVFDMGPSGPHLHPVRALAFRDAARRVLRAARARDRAALTTKATTDASQAPMQAPAVDALADFDESPSALAERERTVLVVARCFGCSRGLLEPAHDQLVEMLRERELTVLVHTPAMGLVESLRLYARAGVVLGAHGSGLVNTAVLRSGTAVFEALPMGQFDTGLYFVAMSHALRTRHTVLSTPGSHQTLLALDEARAVEAVCTAARCRNGTVAQLELYPDPLPQRHCIASPRAPALPPQSVYEPLKALVPLCNDTHVCPLVSPSGKLPLRNVRGLAVILNSGSAVFSSTDPSQRRLIRSLERAHILPVALFHAKTLSSLLSDEQRYALPCDDNIFLRSSNETQRGFSYGAQIANAAASVRRAQPPGAPPLRVYVLGLSFGARFSSVFAANYHVDAVVSMLNAPAHVSQDAYAPLSPLQMCSETEALPPLFYPDEGDAGGVHYPARDVPSLPRSRGKVPAYWIIDAPYGFHVPVDEIDIAMRTITALAPNREHVRTSFVPSGVSIASFHGELPWLLSRAASRVVIAEFVARGVLVADPPRWVGENAPLACAAGFESVFSVPRLRFRNPDAMVYYLGHQGARCGGRRFVAFDSLYSLDAPCPIAEALHAAMQALVFIASPAERAGLPFFFVWGDPQLPTPFPSLRALPGSYNRVSRSSYDLHHVRCHCEVRDMPWYELCNNAFNKTGDAFTACPAGAKTGRLLMYYLIRKILEMLGGHEHFHYVWEDVVAWLVRAGEQRSSLRQRGGGG